jgi:hypothetical protein
MGTALLMNILWTACGIMTLPRHGNNSLVLAYIANLPKEKPDPFRVKNPYIPPGIDPNAKVKPWPKTSPWDDPVYEAEILGAIRKSTGLDGGDSK